MVLRMGYAMPGTDIAYAAPKARREARGGGSRAVGDTGSILRTRYAMSGTDIAPDMRPRGSGQLWRGPE
eukprot:1803940-Rhodomonas_salina.8